MTKPELVIENLWTQGTVYSSACAVLVAALMEEFGEDVDDKDIDTCIRRLQEIKADLKND